MKPEDMRHYGNPEQFYWNSKFFPGRSGLKAIHYFQETTFRSVRTMRIEREYREATWRKSIHVGQPITLKLPKRFLVKASL